MKNKYQVVPQTATAKKPAKAEISDSEFRRRLKSSLNGERSVLLWEFDHDNNTRT